MPEPIRPHLGCGSGAPTRGIFAKLQPAPNAILPVFLCASLRVSAAAFTRNGR